MRMNLTQPKPSLRASRALQAALWIVAIGAPSFVLYRSGVQAAQRETEERVLTEVAHTIQAPSSSRTDVLSTLSQHEKEVSRARYFRTCSRLGMKPEWSADWNGLFTNLARQGKEEQARAARIIADECGLSPDSTLKRERTYLTLSLVAATGYDVLPTSMQGHPAALQARPMAD